MKVLLVEDGKPSRRVKKFYLLKTKNLIALSEKPSRPRKIKFTEKLTNLNTKKICVKEKYIFH
jgi:hypothetical protein